MKGSFNAPPKGAVTQRLRTASLGRAEMAWTLRGRDPTLPLPMPPLRLSIYRKMKKAVRKLIATLLPLIRILECLKYLCWESSWLPAGMPSDHDP